MSLMARYYRWRFGNPAMGRITEHARLSYPFEEGAEAVGRIEAAFGPASTLAVADLGCGYGASHPAGQILRAPWRRLVSVEGFAPYAARLRQSVVAAARHDVIEDKVENFFARLSPGEIDVAVMIDVIEHFRRREAMALLRKLEQWVGKGIVLFLPLGFVDQDPYDENPLQRHLSYWCAEDLSRLGYSVEIYRGLHGQLSPPADAGWAIKHVNPA